LLDRDAFGNVTIVMSLHRAAAALALAIAGGDAARA
jgi:hypothetical protein